MLLDLQIYLGRIGALHLLIYFFQLLIFSFLSYFVLQITKKILIRSGIKHTGSTLLVVLSFAFILYSNLWVTKPDNFFLADDYNYLELINFKTFSNQLTILPTLRYNDRPVGVLVMDLLISITGLNSTFLHVLLLVIHIFNCLLMYVFLKKIFHKNIQHGLYIALFATMLFGTWPKSLHAVSWMAAVFDLFGATVYLLLLNTYLIYRMHRRSIILLVCGALLFYLGLRTKEMILTLPVVLFLIDIYEDKNHKLNLFSVVLFCISIFYYILLQFFTIKSFTTVSSDQYFITYNPEVILTNIFRYVYMFFDFSKDLGIQDIFISYHPLFFKLSILFVIFGIFLSIFSFTKRKKLPMLFMLSFVVSLIPILPIKNFQHILYLYIPSIFMSIFISIVLVSLLSFFIEKLNYELIFISLAVGILLLTTSSSVFQRRAFRFMMGKNNRLTAESLLRYSNQTKYKNIYITGDIPNYSSLSIGNGKAVKIYLDDPNLNVRINSVPTSYITPFLLFRYDTDGSLYFTSSSSFK